MEKAWSELTSDEKREERFKKWLSPTEAKFDSTAAGGLYKERVQRLIDVINVNEPDRVPVMLPITFFPTYYSGSNLRTVMYDYDELRRTWFKFLDDFELDIYPGPGVVSPGRIFEKLDYKLFNWPGHGLDINVTSQQYVEGEYMKPDEYDTLIEDP